MDLAMNGMPVLVTAGEAGLGRSNWATWRPDYLAGHVRLELANPSASYLIGIP
jgi:hypothetical protein